MYSVLPIARWIGGTLARLKPERVQERLARLPDWVLAGIETGIYRVFRFHRTETAAAFAAYATQLGHEHGQEVEVTVSWNQVTVLVPARGGLTDAEFDFAECLMQIPHQREGQREATVEEAA